MTKVTYHVNIDLVTIHGRGQLLNIPHMSVRVLAYCHPDIQHQLTISIVVQCPPEVTRGEY